MKDFIRFGIASFTQEEVIALEKAVEDTKKSNSSHGIYHLLEERARTSNQREFSQYELDAYLEVKGLKSSEMIIPPCKLRGGYTLAEKYIERGTILPSWWCRGDGAILYMHRWWGTESPAAGWCEFAWFQVESALKYEQVSEWKPIEHYMHKRKYWEGEQIQGSIGPYRPLYSVIVKPGEIDLG